MANNIILIPPHCKVKELVHKFLFNGKIKFHTCATIIKITPMTNNRTVVFKLSFVVVFFNKVPAYIPRSAVEIAGMVETRPSGSCMPRYNFPGSRIVSK